MLQLMCTKVCFNTKPILTQFYYLFFNHSTLILIKYQLKIRFHQQFISMPKKEELEKYLKQEVHPVFEALVTQLLIKTPKGQELIPFCIEWMQKKLPKSSKTARSQFNKTEFNSEDDDMDEEEQKKFAAKMAHKKVSKVVKTRAAVSAEVYGDYNKKEDFKPTVIPKAEDVKKRILTRLKQSFMFANLDEKETDIVIDAMEEKNFKTGDFVIKQGEDGNCLFVVDEGKLDCHKRFGSEQKFIKTYVPGQAFGELSLLYNAPRAATITSNGNSVLFALDRSTFNNIVKESAEKKRRAYQQILNKVELLKDMDSYERNQISDVLKEVKVKSGEFVIKQGDVGDKFYIVHEGKLSAIKKDSSGNEKVVLNYKDGDYFGELALLKDIPRQASVKALSDCKLMYIQRSAFKRMLGPVENILERNTESYKKFAGI